MVESDVLESDDNVTMAGVFPCDKLSSVTLSGPAVVNAVLEICDNMHQNTTTTV